MEYVHSASKLSGNSLCDNDFPFFNSGGAPGRRSRVAYRGFEASDAAVQAGSSEIIVRGLNQD
jgi:hypothetical protein